MAKEVDAITKVYDLLLWLIPKIEKFPRSQKYLVGDRIENLMLDVLELLIDAAYSRKKQQALRGANLKLEKLRYLVRLSKDLKLLNMKGYEFSSRAGSQGANVRVGNHIDCQMGGWRFRHIIGILSIESGPLKTRRDYVQ